MNVEGKNILVVGLAASGVAAANFLIRRGARVTVTDIKDESALRDRIEQVCGPVRLALGGHRDQDFLSADTIILSPGVPASLPQLAVASQSGIPVYAEVELAYRFLKGTVVGVTGSNGKTTTTALIGELFKQSGKTCLVAGNIGPPMIDCVDASSPGTTFVVELSSFQLETIESFRCHIAAVLNVTPDHLDRYTDFHGYLQAKERIFLNQTEEDFAVLNADNSCSRGMVNGRRARPALFSRRDILKEGVFVQEGAVRIRWEGREQRVCDVSEIRLKGNHNLENVLAAAAVAYLSGLDLEVMREVFRTFAGVEHRLEFVRRLGGVDYYNDSKATNVDSACQALCAFDQPLIVIMGGKDKGGDFTALQEVVKKRVKLLVLLGAAGDKIWAALGHVVPTVRAGDMNEAVELACSHAETGDAVLLSPACASFDMFENFEHRGRVFKQAVAELED